MTNLFIEMNVSRFSYCFESSRQVGTNYWRQWDIISVKVGGMGRVYKLGENVALRKNRNPTHVRNQCRGVRFLLEVTFSPNLYIHPLST